MILLLGVALAASPCPDLDDRVRDARAALGTAPEDSLRLVEALDPHCLRSADEVPTLATAWRIAGAASWYLDQGGDSPEARAEAWFRRALALDDAPQDPDEIGPSPAALYERLRRRAAPEAEVAALAPLWLDGETLKAGESRAVRAGSHLVFAADGEGAPTVLDVPPEGRAWASPPGWSGPEEQGPTPRRTPWIGAGFGAGVAGAGLVLLGARAQDRFDHDVDFACYDYEGTYADCLKANPELRGLRNRCQAFSLTGWAAIAAGYGLVVRGATLEGAALEGARVQVGLDGPGLRVSGAF